MKYVLIESRDPFESVDSTHFSELIQGIASQGHETILFFIQNGVLPLRRGAKLNDRIADLMKAKVKVLADAFSLRERAIRDVISGVEAVPIKQLVRLIMEPDTKVIWH